MSDKNALIDLSKAEYDILRVLWKTGKLTVREVHDQLTKTYNWAYTTTKTMMDRMVAKEMLLREEYHGIFLYQPLISRPMGLARMVQFFADRVLEMDSAVVVSLFAKSKAISQEEIDELNDLLKKLEKKDE